jgi:hypothetical protein
MHRRSHGLPKVIMSFFQTDDNHQVPDDPVTATFSYGDAEQPTGCQKQLSTFSDQFSRSRAVS